ncbi:replication initiation protein [Spirosoma endophyticum]|uniref:Initiator Replication protein n=1 Tax=Spirosoma endophyticum TaxID=662367 RepID=A0A1I2HIZ6_9BACT|nr:replication initiation protein [Spirosoma endophyticum]SFF28736.1 Initiator Replication protein [Spirosoma endophyticum]
MESSSLPARSSRNAARKGRHQQVTQENNQLAIDFYSETVKKSNTKSQSFELHSAQTNEMIVKSIVREPMRLLHALMHLTVLERRLYWLVLNQIRNIQYRNPDQVKPYGALTFYFHSSDIIANDVKWSVTYIKDIIKLLGKRAVDWETEEGVYTHLTVFPTAQYIRGKGVIMLQLHPLLIPGFLELGNNFAQFELYAALKLTSEYAQLLYSYLSRHAWRGKWVIDLNAFKEIMGATSKSYEEFSNIRIRILEPAMEQISKFTDLDVSYVTMGVGRKVSSLEFTIAFKEVNSLEASREIEETSKHKLKEALETVANYTLEEKQIFAHASLRDYYSQFTADEKHQILNTPEFLNRFCIAECYISSGQVGRDKHDAYMRKSVFFPTGANQLPAPNSAKKGKN